MRQLLLIGIGLVWLTGCVSSTPLSVNEDIAIASTNAFIQHIMARDYQAAYDHSMSPGIKFNPASRFEQFSADWDAIFEKYGPIVKAAFEAYQPVPGRRVIQLYYRVEHEKVVEPIMYHFVLEQDKKGTVTIFMIDIGDEKPYPPAGGEGGEKKHKEQSIEVLPPTSMNHKIVLGLG